MTETLIQSICAGALPIIFAITLHEAAHAYAAKFFGDTTAFAAGRMTLNPAKHIDPIGTIVMPLALYLLSSGTILFGYAKPVPVNFGNLRKPKRDMAWVALAGPMANFVMAFGWLLMFMVISKAGFSNDFLLQMSRFGVMFNLILFAFNLFPIPPLDGGRIVMSLLPPQLALRFAKLEPYGFIILLVLIAMGGTTYWTVPVSQFALSILRLLASPFALL